MDKGQKYNKTQMENNSINSFPEIEINFSSSKEQVWDQLSSKMDLHSHSKTRVLWNWKSYAVAATILMLVSSTLFLRLYTRTIHCPMGQHMSVVLPDLSQVELNANSDLKYTPYWWKISRKVEFNGEGFFNITPGSKFQIISPKGITEIMGTSFNIYARDQHYKVTCFTGKVKVASTQTTHQVILLPKDQVQITENGTIELTKNIEPQKSTMWRENRFFFTATQLSKVFREIELQYNIHIVEKGRYNMPYTGNFKKQESVEEVLNLVCIPFDLKFIRGPKNQYIITTKENR